MRTFLFVGILFTVFSINSLSGQLFYSSEDKITFDETIELLQSSKAESYGDTLVMSGKLFLGIPYVEKTLEKGLPEKLVINLRGMDCTTFVENTLAFSLISRQRNNDFEHFTRKLRTIRYRDGKLIDYPSRLHYFTDWIRNNNEKGIVKNITADLDGEIIQKDINFMGTHRDLYPALASDAHFKEIRKTEEELSSLPYCYLPQHKINSQEENIQNGDVIALTTSIKGLDVTHTGFAIKIDGRLHLLHASSSGEVKISEQPLIDYLKKIKNNTGIIVARPL